MTLGVYKEQKFPQIPCLVERNGSYYVRHWNVTYECWDDEDGDDAWCKKDEVRRWMYLTSAVREVKMTANYAWTVYNFVQEYKIGEFGVMTLQQALDKEFEKYISEEI